MRRALLESSFRPNRNEDSSFLFDAFSSREPVSHFAGKRSRMPAWQPNPSGARRPGPRSSRRRNACSANAVSQAPRWTMSRPRHTSPRARSTTISKPRRRCSKPCSTKSRRISSPKSSGQRAPKTMRSRRWPREPRPTSPPVRPTQPARSFFATGRPFWAGSAGAKSMPGISAEDSRSRSHARWRMA